MDVAVHVDDRLARHARIHRGLGDRRRDVAHQARIERRGDDVFGPERRPATVEGGCDLIGHLLARQIGQRLGGGDLHRLVDGRGLHVERAAEDEGEAEHIVDLVGVVRAARRHDGVGAHRMHVLGADLGIGVGHGEDDRLVGHARDHVAADDATGREPQEDVGADDGLGERARLGLPRVGLLPAVHQLLAALVDDALDVGDEDVLALDADGDEQIEAGQRRRARARAGQLDLADVLADDAQRIQNARRDDDRGAVLVVVEDGDVEQFLEAVLDDEAVGGLDVLEVDAAERGTEVTHRVDEGLDLLGGHAQVDGVDVGEALEQRRLALHHRLRCQRAQVAHAEDSRAVGNDGDEVALARVVVGGRRIIRDGAHRHRDARRVGQRQVALGRERLGRLNLELAGLAGGMELEGFLRRGAGLGEACGHGCCGLENAGG